MPKYKTERIILDGAEKKELDFKIDVFINEDGFFTATLPDQIASLFKEKGIVLKTNGRRDGRLGFYKEAKYFDLIESIKFSCKEYVSRELIKTSIVIRYSIETTCAYLIDEKNNEIVPNGRWVSDFQKENGSFWREGTESQHASAPHPFGVRMYAKPFHKLEYRYKSGKETVEYKAVDEYYCTECQPNLKWIAAICSAMPTRTIHEIPYTEKSALFFVMFYKTICGLNEKLKDFIEPDNLLDLIESHPLLLEFKP